MHRPIHQIAADIARTWLEIPDEAYPYMIAMLQLKDLNSTYYLETATSIVEKFLKHADRWKGKQAREIKMELYRLIGPIEDEIDDN